MLGQIWITRRPVISATSYMALSSLSTLAKRVPNLSALSAFLPSIAQRYLLPVALPVSLQVAAYKARVVLRRRCPSCYFIRRDERLFVECLEKPRHKQMQRMTWRQQRKMREDPWHILLMNAVVWLGLYSPVTIVHVWCISLCWFSVIFTAYILQQGVYNSWKYWKFPEI